MSIITKKYQKMGPDSVSCGLTYLISLSGTLLQFIQSDPVTEYLKNTFHLFRERPTPLAGEIC